jgi:hypothetical protein
VPPPASPTPAIAASSPRTLPWPPPAWPRDYLCEGSPACWESATPKTTGDARAASDFIDAADIPLAAEHGVVRAVLVNPRAKAGRAHGECAMSQLAFGGSLFTSSGHRPSINSRIGSEMASMCLKSRTSLWMRSISAEWMIRPSKTRATHSGVSSWSLRPILRRMR